MKKRIVCLTLALMMSAMQVVSVSASREDELREEQAITSQQLDATYSRMDELANAKAQLESEISELDSSLVSVMVSIDTLKNDIEFTIQLHQLFMFSTFLYFSIFQEINLIGIYHICQSM